MQYGNAVLGWNSASAGVESECGAAQLNCDCLQQNLSRENAFVGGVD